MANKILYLVNVFAFVFKHFTYNNANFSYNYGNVILILRFYFC